MVDNMTTMSSSIWEKLLTAPSTSEAIERASHHSILDIQQTPLPIPFDEMSPNAQENLRAISRAFEVSLGGIEVQGWNLWTDGARGMDDWQMAILEIKQSRPRPEEDGAPQSSLTISDSKTLETEKSQAVENEITPASNLAGESEEKKRKHLLNKSSHGSGTHSSLKVSGNQKKGLDAEVKKNAELIRNWALFSPHTEPSQVAIDVLLGSAETSRILQYIVPNGSTPLMRAAVISCFTERIGSSAANVMMEETIIPYVQILKAPAPREVMTAVVNFCTFHWRAALGLYTHIAHSDQKVNGAIAELLARVAAGISPEAALSALKEYSRCTWGEDGIRVIEALMAKSKDQPGVVSAIAPSLEKNVIGMEKSVRFGKLLFTMVKEFPVVENEYEQVLESVAARSKVFLAKRALSYMKNKK
ncbi:unnamed protein product [Agarophyton chilense]